MPRPHITFETGVGTVTGSNFLVETKRGEKFLVDCGMMQGSKVALDVNYEKFAYGPASIHAVLVTHAHLDHIGRIPKLVKEGFTGVIYSTPETRALAELVLTDAVGIISQEARQNDREPMYDLDDVQKVFPMWKTAPYHKTVNPIDGVSFLFKDAGHILGSSMIEVDVDGTKILFSGDLGNSPAPILADTEPIGDVEYLVLESTYGDRNHESREERTEKLRRVILDTVHKGGTLIIPSFSVDRTQVMLYELNNMVEKKQIPSVPIFVDSPMAIKATDIYKSSTQLFNPRVQEEIRRGDDIFSFPKLEFAVTQGESRHIESIDGPKIILAGSGMSVGGRVISHEERYLPDPKNTLLLVGYQSVGSIGRELAEGAKKVTIHGRTIKVKARVDTLYGYSAHKDSDHLVEFITTATSKLKKVFVTHGELGSSMHLAQRLHGEFGLDAVVPERGEGFEL